MTSLLQNSRFVLSGDENSPSFLLTTLHISDAIQSTTAAHSEWIDSSASATMWVSLDWLAGVSCVAFALTFNVIPSFADSFVKAGIFGRDLCKRGEAGQRKVPEATGVVSGCVFLMATIMLIPVTFLRGDVDDFPHVRFGQLLSALLSIACMLLMGFADDVLDLRWRHKLLLPTLASFPMLVVYYVTSNRSVTIFICYSYKNHHCSLSVTFVFFNSGLTLLFR
jgi:UDP-N-acetylmuramyl pentapeptide phosphotransferase/UDP-N-acetylglucosamine-1-phosphate transferase